MELLKKWRREGSTSTEKRKKEILEDWIGEPHFPNIVLSKRILENESFEENEGGEIVIDLFDELKVENLNEEPANTFLPPSASVSDQALILPFFSAEAIAISEVAICFQNCLFQTNSELYLYRCISFHPGRRRNEKYARIVPDPRFSWEKNLTNITRLGR